MHQGVKTDETVFNLALAEELTRRNGFLAVFLFCLSVAMLLYINLLLRILTLMAVMFLSETI